MGECPKISTLESLAFIERLSLEKTDKLMSMDGN